MGGSADVEPLEPIPTYDFPSEVIWIVGDRVPRICRIITRRDALSVRILERSFKSVALILRSESVGKPRPRISQLL
jgi:hypothetical protein